MTTPEAMRAAIEEAQGDPGRSAEYRLGYFDAYKEVFAALESALAAPVQEPVAWRRKENGQSWWTYYETKAWDDLQPLYAAHGITHKAQEAQSHCSGCGLPGPDPCGQLGCPSEPDALGVKGGGNAR